MGLAIVREQKGGRKRERNTETESEIEIYIYIYDTQKKQRI